MRTLFDVEQAGCESCGRLISAALSGFGAVESIDIDEDSDIATVVLAGSAARNAVEVALEEASAGTGHVYRVRDNSWRHLP